jgi:hypothetical protein
LCGKLFFIFVITWVKYNFILYVKGRATVYHFDEILRLQREIKTGISPS